MPKIRGADLVARALQRAGVSRVFSLSGNHIMPLYDALLEPQVPISHTRHEGAAVHMADAWGRLTGTPGIAMLTGGPGHANGVGALYTALASESPLVMLSGHAPLSELGKGSFQEMRQADMAEPVVKASWMAERFETLEEDIARAVRIATGGRPGPVHLSLPFDLLERAEDGEGREPSKEAMRAEPQRLADRDARGLVDFIRSAKRPLCLVGPVLSETRAGRSSAELSDALGAPVLCMESPRGLNDPALGALSDIVARADAVLLLGKPVDFTLRFGRTPAFAADCRFAVVDPDPTALRRSVDLLGAGRVMLSTVADSVPAAQQLIEAAGGSERHARSWTTDAEAAVAMRPAVPDNAAQGDSVHPAEVGRAVEALLQSARDVVFISDGGEFGQWAQACVRVAPRLINGQSGSIGSAIPFAVAAKLARPDALVVAMTGDGSSGFHLLETDTAVRQRLGFVTVIGNDACWNAEYQIQLRTYGRERAHGCELLPTRYEQVVAALGGHGEYVCSASDLPGALKRAAACGLPACVNVRTGRVAAPTMSARAAPSH